MKLENRNRAVGAEHADINPPWDKPVSPEILNHLLLLVGMTMTELTVNVVAVEQPPMRFDLSLGESAGSHSLH
jgi:hypothetical protein